MQKTRTPSNLQSQGEQAVDDSTAIETVTSTPVQTPIPELEEQSPPYLKTTVSIRDKYVIPEKISLNLDSKKDTSKKKPFYFIGLNSQEPSNNWKWGMEDSPPPYH